MSNAAYRTLVDRTLSKGVNRRKLIGSAAAAGAGAALFTPKRFYIGKAQTPTPVTFWTTFTEPDLGHLQAITDAFNAENPDVLVTLTQIPPEEVTDVSKLVTAVRGGEGPDVYHVDRFIVAQYAAAGALQDLTELACGADPLEGYLPFARAEATYDDKPYAIPFDTDTRALYYNKTMLTEAGADLAEFDWANGPVTWDRVAEIATALNVKGTNGQYEKVGFVPWFNQGWHYTYGFSWGGVFYDEAACEVTPNNPEVVAAFQWVYDYCAAQGPQELQAFAGESKTPGFPAQENYFTVGTTAFQITGDWHLRQMEQYGPEIDYGVTYIPVPTAGAEPSTWAGGWSLVVPEGAKEPEAAYRFAAYMAGEPGQRVYTKESAHLPTIEALVTEADLYDEGHKFFSEQLLPIAKNRPPLPVGALYWDTLTLAWEATYLNESEPQAALDNAKETVQAELQRFC